MKPNAPLAFLALLCAVAVSMGQESAASKPASRPVPVTPAEKVAAIEAEYSDAMDAFHAAYQKAKPESRRAFFETSYPKASAWFPKLLEIARAHPSDPAAASAYKWIVSQDSDSDDGRAALEALGRDHLGSPILAEVADDLVYANRPEAEAFLRLAMTKSPNEQVRARAAYALGHVLGRFADLSRRLADQSDEEDRKNVVEWCGEAMCSYLRALDAEKARKEAEDLFVMVQQKYAAVPASHGGTLGDRAEADLFELRNLAIGKVAPEIEGEDVHGKPLRLSDFRGKVVVLDFWGHW